MDSILDQIKASLKSQMNSSYSSNLSEIELTGNSEVIVYPNGQFAHERLEGHWRKRIEETIEKIAGKGFKLVIQLPLAVDDSNATESKKADTQATFRVVDKRRKQPFFIVENDLFRLGHAANMKPSGLAVYTCLLMHINADSECWPSYKTIAKLTGQSRYGVIKIVRRLADLGYVNIRHCGENGRFTSNTLTILEYPEIHIP